MLDALVELHKPHRRACCLDKTWAAEHWAEGGGDCAPAKSSAIKTVTCRSEGMFCCCT